ncbi:MAG: hypothetical protein ABIA21_01300, partial [Candidatus Aenigmatarchaeota archaeon]
ETFAFYEMILGAKLGTIMTLGIGPIVTASIILQLLVGSKILPWNLSTPEGRSRFQGTQKLMVILFSIVEAIMYVNIGAVPVSDPGNSFLMIILIVQIAFGGILVLFMDETVSKWGIGSGVSLFIAAGVTKTIFVRMFSPCVPINIGINLDMASLAHIGKCVLPDTSNMMIASGHVLSAVQYSMIQDFQNAALSILPIISTFVVFFIVVYIQAIYVDIPLAFTSMRGFGRRWPLKFLYTSNIPVILCAALLANAVLIGAMVAKTPMPDSNINCGFLGCFNADNQPVSGLAFYLSEPRTQSIQIFSLIMLVVVFVIAFLILFRKLNLSKKMNTGVFVITFLALAAINFMIIDRSNIFSSLGGIDWSILPGLLGMIVADIILAVIAAIMYKKDSRTSGVMLMALLIGFAIAFFVTSGTFVGVPQMIDVIRLITYLTTFIILCTIFSIFWVSTSGMDAETIAGQIEDLGMQIPGFRRDPRIVRDILNRYIPILAVLGGAAVGLLAAVADLTGALGTGTGILLTVMIVYNFYEIIMAKHLDEMHPSMRKFFEK